MPRPSRLLTCTAAALLATGLTGAGLFLTGLGPHTGLATSLTADAATSWPAHVFAPYVDTGLSNTTLTTVASDYGTKYFELAFADGGGCQWSLPNQSGWQSQVSALQAEGGDVSISFGGYTVDTDGTDLGNQCSSASAMATQVESVVTTMNVTHLDFDIESSEETNSTDFTRTAQALALVRSWASSTGRALNISYTLPVLPSGFTSDGLNVLNAAQSSGFKPDVVNVMTMDYGTSGTEMGTASNQALDAAAGQVASVFGESTSGAYAMLGNTPMIGQNDSPGEIFSLADASTVESHAVSEGIALVSFWAEGRDNGGCPGQTSASSTCSGLSQSTGAFTQAFQAFTSGSTSGGGGTGPTPPPTTPPPTSPPPTSPPPTSGSCDAAWSNSTAYTSGNEVSYSGHNWTASQWNYDEVPGGASGAWNDDGAC
jgi:Glycosyl hydrolases family 18